ncbi:MAG TPA: hypothetical protein VFF86_04570, partial [Candidatus Methylomirabilis sp.]|nr:hypothetical protein [Candidatus Methylomirabilis sp.]
MGGDLGISEELASRLAWILEELKQGDLPPDVLRLRLRSLLDHPAHAIPLLLRQFESDDEEGLALATSALKALDDPSLIAASIHLQEALEGPRSTEAP